VLHPSKSAVQADVVASDAEVDSIMQAVRMNLGLIFSCVVIVI